MDEGGARAAPDTGAASGAGAAARALTRVVMVATAADWQGTARIPAALAAGGFEPFLLGP